MGIKKTRLLNLAYLVNLLSKVNTSWDDESLVISTPEWPEELLKDWSSHS